MKAIIVVLSILILTWGDCPRLYPKLLAPTPRHTDFNFDLGRPYNVGPPLFVTVALCFIYSY